MTTLQLIIKKAKALKAAAPKKYAKWTDYVKAASATITPKKKESISGVKKKTATKKVVKKAAPKKAAKKSTSYHKDTKSHNVRINVVSGLAQIKGIPHKAKYYIDYKRNGVKVIEYFDKLPKGYYKGMDSILYMFTLTDSGSSLVPIINVKTGKIVKK